MAVTLAVFCAGKSATVSWVVGEGDVDREDWSHCGHVAEVAGGSVRGFVIEMEQDRHRCRR